MAFTDVAGLLVLRLDVAPKAAVVLVIDEGVLPDDGLGQNLGHPATAVLSVLQLPLRLPVAAGLAVALRLLVPRLKALGIES